MDDTQLVLRNVFSNPMAILYIAIALGALFLCLIALDLILGSGSKRHGHRQRPPPETLGQKLLKPFKQVRMAAKVLLDAAHRRARRRARSERLAEQMRRYRS